MKQMPATKNGSAADAELHVGETVLHMPIEKGTEGERAMDVSALLKTAGVTPLVYGYANRANTHSAITFLDGDNGILRYRGYPIEQLAEHSTYLEVAYLLLNGELPNKQQLEEWTYNVTHHTFLHDNVRKRFMEGFHYDAHPMGMFVSGLAALSTYYPEAKDIFDPENRHKQILRLIAKTPTLAAYCHRFSVGMPTVYPDNELSYTGNFLNMLWKVGEYEVNPKLE